MDATSRTEALAESMGNWAPSGHGLTRTHTNPDGWKIRKDMLGAWTIRRPDGSPADEWTWGNLRSAQIQAFEYAQK